MSYDVYISVKVSENVVFDNIDALNADLLKSSAGELVYRILDTDYDIVKFDNGVMRFVDADTIEYFQRRPPANAADFDKKCWQESVNVWACWQMDASDVLAKHLKSGKIVLQFVGEDDEIWYHKIEPNKASTVEPQF